MPPHESRRPLSAQARARAPTAAALQPAMWCPGCRGTHDTTRTFKLEGVTVANAHVVVAKAVDAFMALPPPHIQKPDERLAAQTLEVHTSKQGFVSIWLWTPAEWFDLLELRFKPVKGAAPGAAEVLVRARTFSTGVAPLSCTGSLCCNIICCCAPFVGAPPSRITELQEWLVRYIADNPLVASETEASPAPEPLGMQGR
jgi:hypothetical protein